MPTGRRAKTRQKQDTKNQMVTTTHPTPQQCIQLRWFRMFLLSILLPVRVHSKDPTGPQAEQQQITTPVAGRALRGAYTELLNSGSNWMMSCRCANRSAEWSLCSRKGSWKREGTHTPTKTNQTKNCGWKNLHSSQLESLRSSVVKTSTSNKLIRNTGF